MFCLLLILNYNNTSKYTLWLPGGCESGTSSRSFFAETAAVAGSTEAFGLPANMAGRDDDSRFWFGRAPDVHVWSAARGAADAARGILIYSKHAIQAYNTATAQRIVSAMSFDGHEIWK